MIIWKQICSLVSSGIDAIDLHEILLGPLFEIVPIVMQYHVSFFMALVPQLQL
jgi:hypothetical protein